MEAYLILLLLTSTTALFFPTSLSSENSKYDACSTQKLQSCGNIRVEDLGYPFYDGSTLPDYCGHPGCKLDCEANPPQINISDLPYKLLSVNTESINVSKTNPLAGTCPSSLENTTLDFSKFSFTSSDQNITFFYHCDNTFISGLLLTVNCNVGESLLTGYYLTPAMIQQYNKDLNCHSNIFLPILLSEAEAVDYSPVWPILSTALQAGFELGVNTDLLKTCTSCTDSNGACGYDWDANKFACHCANGTYDISCGLNSKTKASLAGIGIGILCLLILFSLHLLQKFKPLPKNQQVEDLLKNYESIGPRRYNYANIMKMTNSFREKLGEGGYGTVFKGKLEDGHVVAVKVWKHSKGDGQEFINEVVSISRTSHVNIVPLLGFCFEADKCALIYEFMSNGSLEKFTSITDPNKYSLSFTAPKLLEIAIGIAKGLEYLHQGCSTRIVHFDIKPHNIMLNDEFIPKISDFGLAKPFKKKESMISMSEARGTIGYIAPEVFYRSLGGVSHKSDVYSYGMMVLEMVGCSEKPDGNSENSSEMYFPQWIYKKLEEQPALNSGRILNNENELKRKMILVGLWCIQTNPSDRPAMSRVVEMLEGEVELLRVPPMPSLFSLPRQQHPTEDGSATLLSSSSSHSYVITST